MGEDFIIREYIMKKLAIYGKGGIGYSNRVRSEGRLDDEFIGRQAAHACYGLLSRVYGGPRF